MIESKESSATESKSEAPKTLDDISLLINWLQHAASTGSEIFDLFQLEVRLAVTDMMRLMVLAKLLIPMLVLTWMSFSALLTWQAYLCNSSVTQGLLFLCLLQFCGLLLIALGWKHYRKSISLPLTRKHIQQFFQGQSRDS